MIFDFLKSLVDLTRKTRMERLEKAELRRIAKHFNNRYTYRKPFDKDLPRLEGGAFGLGCNGGFAWMCPDCNRIHYPTELSGISGLQYPRCCSTPQGNRLCMSIRYK